MAQLWGGRFTKETDKLVYNFNASINFDKKFYKQDMEGSIAHVKMLAAQTRKETKLSLALKVSFVTWRMVLLKSQRNMKIFTAL
jgi:argininosuccinate lyase